MKGTNKSGTTPDILARVAASAPRVPVAFRLADRNVLDLNAPDPELLTPELIAIGLGNVCRYSGQVDPFYSVAEHSLLVAERVPPELRLAALLHDASEGLGMSDVIGPLKAVLPEYKAIEDRLMRAVEARFGLEPGACEHPLIKEADRRVLRTEQLVLRGVVDEIRLPRERDVEPYSDVAFVRLAPLAARGVYLRELYSAMGDRWTRR